MITVPNHHGLANSYCFAQEFRLEFDDDFLDVPYAIQKLEWVSKASNRFNESILLPKEDHHERAAPEHSLIKADIGFSASVLERQLPAHTGALLMDLKSGLHNVGIQIANHNALVLSTAHLYKALRAMGAMDKEWKDMDWVLSSIKGKQPLVAKMTGSTYDGEAAVRCYWLTLGASLTGFARNARKSNKVMCNEPRKIGISTPLLQK